ncbi:hypothetical protein SAMN05216233_12540 [Desulfoluna spongiiphila]|uniref:Uncharacterized protein n=1 Tax=Desulfoluna spongiiphila TaxID=419481 RepID=A0A1G5J5X1_9BACT|nr:hypothetical protein SAMN05216233_12540 [Desulfoluna spongiiphila]VVS92984.1 hypothetical protein DBB_25520 [Desulfoluna spongiiphila]
MFHAESVVRWSVQPERVALVYNPGCGRDLDQAVQSSALDSTIRFVNEGGQDLIIPYVIVSYTEIINIKKSNLPLF